MEKDTQSRKWQITINNPLEKGFTHDRIKEILSSLKLVYWCMADEIGENGTYHTHIYILNTHITQTNTSTTYTHIHITHIPLT